MDLIVLQQFDAHMFEGCDIYFVTVRSHGYKWICKILTRLLVKQINPPLMGERAFPLTGLVCESAHVTFGGSSGIMSNARPALPYP